MSDWMPCPLGLSYILIAAGLGYLAGCYREQLRLLETLKPEV
jgi:hypothetical protein